MTPDVRLTQTLKRRLRNGDWVYVSGAGQLVVLSNETVEKLNSIDLLEERTVEELIGSGILTKDIETNVKKKSLRKEPDGGIFKAACLIMTVFGSLALILSLVFMALYGFPFVSAAEAMLNNPIKFMVIAVGTSIVSTMMHELMHIVFSTNVLRIDFNIKKSVATVPLTHVWTWSLLGRVSAITSGLSLDAVILLLTFYIPHENGELFSIISAVMLTRILWQFRITQSTDINILFRFLFDNPFLFEDLNRRQTFLAKIVSFIGTLAIVVAWMLPLINKMLQIT